MKRELNSKNRIKLRSGSIETVFEINETIGKGGSCVAYKVTYAGVDGARHRGILKEYFPVWIVSDDFERTQDEITVPDDLKAAFEEGLRSFREIYDFITDFIVDNEQAANYHSEPMRYYEGNNTGYVLSYYFSGKSYDKVKDEGLLSVFEVVLSTARAVEQYHKNGYLHLDIKAKNILVQDETTQSIKLFDFDSITKYESIRAGEIRVLPAPEDYRVPDFDTPKWLDVDYRTDIFEIGAMLFIKLFGRAPMSNDIAAKSKICLDDNKYLRTASPALRYRVAEILKKTIVVNPDRRYSDISELISAVERVIELIDSDEPYFINMPKWQPSANAIVRKNELRELDGKLEKDGCVFVRGIGGLGKSELAKLYARSYAGKYHTVQFYHFSGNLKTTLATMTVAGINERDFDDFESLVRAKNALLHQSDKGMLIIIDNFNIRNDSFLRDFIPADSDGFKVIFTTRCSPSSEAYRPYVYDIPQLSLDDCKKLFYMHYEAQAEECGEEADLEKLIEYVNYNTLMIILIAETLKNSVGMSVSDIYEKFINQKIDSINVPVFHEYDNEVEDLQEYSRLYNHLQTVFSIATLSEAQTEILKNATLIPPGGILIDRFVRYCESDNINKATVRDLVSLGWLTEDEDALISMHPVVSDLLALNGQISPAKSYYNFERKQENFCNPRRCGFATAMRKLECAKHLERRYINEPDRKQLSLAMKIGRLHDSLFQSETAKKYLEKALDMAIIQNSDEATALACQYLGDYYREFGTGSQAKRYLERSVELSKKAQFYKIVVEATVQIANCHRDNNENVMAYNAYLRALVCAKRYGILQYITDICDELIEVCDELGWVERLRSYSEFSALYKEFDTDENAELFDEYDVSFAGKETPEEKLKKYSDFLSENCKLLGESSPAYKALHNRLWLYKLYAGAVKEAKNLLSERLGFIEATSGAASVEMAEEKALAAISFADVGAFDEVEQAATEAIKICVMLNDTKVYAHYRACLAMAQISMLEDNTERALRYLDRADASAYQGKTVLTETIKAVGFVLLKAERFEDLEKLCSRAVSHKSVSLDVKIFAKLIQASAAEVQNSVETAEEYIRTATDFVSSMEAHTAYECMSRLKNIFEKICNSTPESVKLFFDALTP